MTETYKYFKALHRGFREQCWHPDYSTSMEPELDWWSDMTAHDAGYTRRWH